MKNRRINTIINKLIFISFLTFCSCATLFNTPSKLITINTSEPSRVVLEKDTFSTIHNHTSFLIPRQSTPLKIIVIGDSLTKTLTLYPRNSFFYWLNAYPTPMFWTGFLIDKKNPKRYTFPGRLYVNMSDSNDHYSLFDPGSRKGQLNFNLSFPWVNSFHLTPDNYGVKSNTGFWGVTFAMEYYHNRQQFFNLGVSGVMDFFIPFPAAVDFIGLHEHMGSAYIAISNNHKVKGFTIGYGVCFAKNTWNLIYSGIMPDTLTPQQQPVKKTNSVMGLIFPIHYELSPDFFTGLVYRPTFFRFSTATKFKYEHLISLEIGFKIPLRKKTPPSN